MAMNWYYVSHFDNLVMPVNLITGEVSRLKQAFITVFPVLHRGSGSDRVFDKLRKFVFMQS